jgi:hypothetical protein
MFLNDYSQAMEATVDERHGIFVVRKKEDSDDKDQIDTQRYKIDFSKNKQNKIKKSSDFNKIQKLLEGIFQENGVTLKKFVIDEGVCHRILYRLNDNPNPFDTMYVNLATSYRQYNEVLKNTSMKEVNLFSANCLFGNSIFGIDACGNRYPMVFPKYNWPDGTSLVDVECKHDVHFYELAAWQAFATFLKFIVMSGVTVKNVYYHIPDENYIIYGLNLFVQGIMDIENLLKYIGLVKKRANMHKVNIANITRNYGVEIKFISSTSALSLKSITSANDLILWFAKIQVSYPPKNSSFLVDGIINFLSQQEGLAGKAWLHAKEKFQHPQRDLLKLNFLSYTVTLAMVAMMKFHCVFGIPIEERAVFSDFKKKFSDFGHVTLFAWIPQVIMQNHHESRCFFSPQLPEVDQYLRKRLVEPFLVETTKRCDNSESMKKIDQLIEDAKNFNPKFFTLCKSKPERCSGRSSTQGRSLQMLDDLIEEINSFQCVM